MKSFLFLAILPPCFCCFAQNTSVKVERNQAAPLSQVINFSDPKLQDWNPYVATIHEEPMQTPGCASNKRYLDSLRRQYRANSEKRGSESRSVSTPLPVILNNFEGNSPQVGVVPNDNHIAISDSGIIVSVVNLNVRAYTETGTQLFDKPLTTFAMSVGVLQNLSDPRVIYDPLEDRFIVLFFAGYLSTTSTIILAFSQSNNPGDTWNFYKLSGNYLNDSTWSDYPVVSISDKDFFMTFNHLTNDSFFPEGFRYSVIWQIDKSTGYNGDTLKFNYWHDVVYQGTPIWNICAIQGGSQPTGPESYFVSVRPHDLTNDTVFLHTISNSYESDSAQFSTQILIASTPYGLPPDAFQKGGLYLATNDARILSGFYQNNRIQYVQNTIDPQNLGAAVYVGEINNPASSSPVASGQLISYDTIDLGYPSIAYIGNNAFDNRAFITCSFSPADTFPGTAAFYKDANGNISDMLVVKTGLAPETLLQDSVQRWGDYTGIQRKYNEPNTAWLSGSYVTLSQTYSSWIAKIVNTDSSAISSISHVKATVPANVFPNPAAEKFSVSIDLTEGNFTRFALFDAGGNLVKILLEDQLDAGTNVFSFNTRYLANGIYFLEISDRGNTLGAKKVVISR